MRRKDTKQIYLERGSLEDANCEATNVEDKNKDVATNNILFAGVDLIKILNMRDPTMMESMKDAKILPREISSCPQCWCPKIDKDEHGRLYQSLNNPHPHNRPVTPDDSESLPVQLHDWPITPIILCPQNTDE